MPNQPPTVDSDPFASIAGSLASDADPLSALVSGPNQTPEKVFRRIPQGYWKYHGQLMRVVPSSDQFEPDETDEQDIGTSVGLSTEMVRLAISPSDAMLWGDYREYALVEIELASINGLGLNVVPSPKPVPPNGEGPWHANIVGFPDAEKDRQRIYKELAKLSVWHQPPHDDLLACAFSKMEQDIREFQRIGDQRKALNKWRDFKTQVQNGRPPDSENILARIEAAIQELT